MAGRTRAVWPYITALLIILILIGLTTHKASSTILPFSILPHSLSNFSRLSSSSSSASSTFIHDPTNTLSYRDHLERTTSPKSQITHSPTLTFDKIYVLSLPHRLDRREQMDKIAKALGLEIEYVDASKKEESFFGWIAERVAETRKVRVQLMAKARKVAAERIGGLHVGNDWLTPTLDKKGRRPFPSPPHEWVAELELAHSSGNLSSLKPSSVFSKSDLSPISNLLWDPNEPQAVRQVNEGVMSTYWGHTRVLKKIVERGESALVLEDDVDLEWDLERMWSRIERKLPTSSSESAWDIVFLGHCWSHELIKPAYLHPLLHQSTSPMCLHSYAVSTLGAPRLLNLLSSPWRAYATAVDLAVPSYISFGLLNGFSIEPPLGVQRKDGPSDLQGGNGSKWRGVLRDSTWERIVKAEGGEWEDEVWNPDKTTWDPARVFREKNRCDESGP